MLSAPFHGIPSAVFARPKFLVDTSTVTWLPGLVRVAQSVAIPVLRFRSTSLTYDSFPRSLPPQIPQFKARLYATRQEKKSSLRPRRALSQAYPGETVRYLGYPRDTTTYLIPALPTGHNAFQR